MCSAALWLQDCAAAVGTELQVAPSLAHFSAPDPTQQISVGLAGDHQLLNASLAVALVSSWEQVHLKQQTQQQHLSNGSSSTAGIAAAAASENAAGRVAAAAERLQQLQSGVLPQAYCDGLQQATWPGRSQVSAMCWAFCFVVHYLQLPLLRAGWLAGAALWQQHHSGKVSPVHANRCTLLSC